ncbi:type II toxin-antitoxin system TacA family antitoxin [Acerihabitans arboris]|uniref:DUF1778 domain-containing protein n=1 Tax=Acerihabitans arboris TaxID=2691583 RepID=A0A845SLA5_9GAMM|nr:DUF1778 domain-containing protein [Acerihabitans arboris]NDL63754.1 DUF1778 domain-containing protein [Acerihabitans arboris]
MATTARLEARIPLELHVLIKHAAGLQGISMTDFIITATHDAAKRAIEETAVLQLAMEDQLKFAETLLEDRDPPTALLRAMGRRKEFGKK